jgi:hypothetical protein
MIEEAHGKQKIFFLAAVGFAMLGHHVLQRYFTADRNRNSRRFISHLKRVPLQFVRFEFLLDLLLQALEAQLGERDVHDKV